MESLEITLQTVPLDFSTEENIPFRATDVISNIYYCTVNVDVQEAWSLLGVFLGTGPEPNKTAANKTAANKPAAGRRGKCGYS